MRDRIVGALSGWGWPGWLVPDYWFMFSAAIIACSFATLYLWSRAGRRDRVAADLLFWGILAVIPGAKLLYALQFGIPITLDGLLRSGMSMYGGLLGILAAWAVVYRIRPYPWKLFLDAAAPGLALGLAIGRIGCFLAGCNGGRPSRLPWAVRFPAGTSSFDYQVSNGLIEPSAALSLPAHPTQLYESLFALAAFVLLVRLYPNRKGSGQVFCAGLFWYSLFRLLSEPLRGDQGSSAQVPGWFTFAQVVSLGVMAAAVGGMYLSRERPRQ